MLTDVQRRLAGRLLPGERVLWTGRPKQGLLLMPDDVIAIPFSVAWTAGISLAAYGGAHPGFPGGALVFVPAFAAGFYFLIGRFLVDGWLRARTFYAVTDRRVLILREGRWGAFRAVDRARLGSMELKESGACGTILFGQPVERGRNPASMLPVLDPTPRFLCIKDARAVFDLIQRMAP